MTIQEIRDSYPPGLWSNYPGDRQLRYELYAPLFTRLHEHKIVIRDRIQGLVTVKEVLLSQVGFEIKVEPYLCIKGHPRYDDLFFKKAEYTFGARWEYVMLGNGYLNAAMISWALWVEPDLVREVERLTLAEDFEAAGGLLRME